MTQINNLPGLKSITSHSNPLIKELKSLQQKKYRDRHNSFVVEGLKLIMEALQQDWKILYLLLNANNNPNPLILQIIAQVKAQGGQVILTNQAVLSNISKKENPQTVIAVCQQRHLDISLLKMADKGTYIALDRIRDPGNLGTIIRTADAGGAKAIILIGETTDLFSPETVRASMGSIFALNIYKASSSQFINLCQHFTGAIIGTHLNATKDYRKLDYDKQANILLMGNEQQGLDDQLTEKCTQLVKIPQIGKADSLNLAIATAIMLYEMQRNNLILTSHKGTL